MYSTQQHQYEMIDEWDLLFFNYARMKEAITNVHGPEANCGIQLGKQVAKFVICFITAGRVIELDTSINVISEQNTEQYENDGHFLHHVLITLYFLCIYFYFLIYPSIIFIF